MKARAGVIVLLLAAACFVAWSTGLLAPGDTAPLAARTPGNVAPVAIADGAEPELDAASRSFATERSAAGEAVVAGRVRVTTVDRDGKLLAGTEVRYWPPRSQAERERDDNAYDQSDVEALLRVAGRLAITDANGTVEIEGDCGCKVSARNGELYTEGYIADPAEPLADELRLELRRDVALRVEVVDAGGKALAGRIVEVRVDGLSARGGRETGSATLSPTDANGAAVLPHVLYELGCSDTVVDGSLVVAIERPDRYGQNERVASRELPWRELRATTDVRLVVDAVGALVARLVDADGRALPSPRCRLRGERESDGPELHSLWSHDDTVRFEGVPLNRRWHLIVDLAFCEHSAMVVGPVATADPAVVDVVVPARSFELAARFVRSDGVPVDHAMVTLRTAAAPAEGWRLTTDERGCIRSGAWHFTTAIGRIDPLELTIRGDLCAPRTLVVDRAIGPGKNDLGDIVVDAPVGETVLARIEARCGGKPVDRTWARLFVRQGTSRREVPVIQRSDGATLELRGVPPATAMLLNCSAPDCVPVRDLPVSVGEHKLVELQHAAMLAVAMLVPEVPRQTIEGLLVRDGAAPIHGDYDDARRAMCFELVAPGSYRLRITIGDRVVHEEAGVTVRAGDNRWPADGSHLDLRHHPRALCIAARSAASGQRLSVGAIQVAARATELTPDAEHYDNDEWFLPTTPASDLLVRAQGHIPVRVVTPSDDVVLQLQPSTEVEVAAPGNGEIAIRMRIVVDPVPDPLLRAFDKHHEHAPERELSADERLWFLPGTVVDFTVMRDGKPGGTERVVVGTASPQRVTLQ